ncbi:MAG: hypothetical protein GAK35_02548 [Herbaspirillum frisingense]|uniref:phosphoglycolate phosphatase n=1 Tax=Herbaspirillum frisingense TaxID=92645 RepID=A0A7V8JTP4_9BURK|nr:MAG: hypothetical protein GAK35_02548 [Herbaspirillum frisingense]
MRSSSAKTSILVLDIDGTLTDSVALHQEAFLGAMQALGLSRLDANWGAYPQHTDTGIFAEAIARDAAQSKRHEVTAFEADLASRFAALLRNRRIEEIPGARAFVEAANASEWGVVFATGGIRGVSGDKLRAIGIDVDDELLLTASEWANRTELVAAAIARAKTYYGIAAPCTVLSIGDGRWDWDVARRLDIRFLGVGRSASAGVLEGLGARVMPDWTDAMSVLAGLGRK